jgi:hypothetical protein
VQPQAAAGTYNFNLPTSAGSSGQPLLSGGGGSSPQTYGTLAVAGGGTGLATLTAHALYVGNGTSAPAALAVGATGSVLAGSTGADPAFSATPTITTLTLTNALGVASGGTGLATLTAHALYVGNGTSAPTALSVGATGTVLAGSTGADPAFTATPSVTSLTLTGASGNTLVVDTSTLVVDATNHRVVIGTTSAQRKFHVYATSGGTYPSFTANSPVLLEAGSDCWLTFFTPNTQKQGIIFADPEAGANHWIAYDHSDNHLEMRLNNAVRLSLTSTVLNYGVAGTTNPAWQVDASAGSAATGLKVTAAAAAGGVTLAAISSGTNEGLKVDAKGSGVLTLASLSTGGVVVGAAGSVLGTIGLAGSTSGTVTVQPAATAGTWTLTLPTTGGTAGYELTTNGSGVSTWTAPRNIEVLADAASITPTMNTDGRPYLGTVAALSQASQFENPSGTPANGQFITFRIISSAARALTWGTLYKGSTALPLPTTTTGTAGLRDYFGFMFNGTQYDFVASTPGIG